MIHSYMEFTKENECTKTEGYKQTKNPQTLEYREQTDSYQRGGAWEDG